MTQKIPQEKTEAEKERERAEAASDEWWRQFGRHNRLPEHIAARLFDHKFAVNRREVCVHRDAPSCDGCEHLTRAYVARPNWNHSAVMAALTTGKYDSLIRPYCRLGLPPEIQPK